ncbi:MAG: acetylornithine deacetylase [Alphaproteobacteria bacterium]|nr:acetylornithine deacetylase [Alphaproteobacteria bacterium]
MSYPSLENVIEILAKLVSFDTTSHQSNLALIEWVEDFLGRRAVPYERVNEGNGKASLLARVGPKGQGGIVLSGHTDVVPTVGQPWSSDPYQLAFRGGRFYGRGTSDMKSFLALALAHVDYWKAQSPRKPIWFAFSHDEEIGCLGAAPMAQKLIDEHVEPSLIVVGEPTEMKLVIAHKGILSYETIITGREAHSSMPQQGVNAVMLMGELIHTLNDISIRARKKADKKSGFTPNYSTVHVGVVEGGTARNIIPRHCRIAWEVRPLPGTDVAEILKPYYEQCIALEDAMKQIDPTTSIVTRQLTNVHGLGAVDEASEHVALAKRLANSNHAEYVSYGTEGGIFQHHGLNTIICGPGSIDQAHQPDEFIESAQLQLGMEFMRRIGA